MRSTRPTLILASAVAMALALTAPSTALCLLCNASVRLDSSLATCFAERAQQEARTLAASGQEFAIIDLSDCSSRGALPTGASTGEDEPLDTQFVADAKSLNCLAAEIAATDDSVIDPSHVFDLTGNCPAQ